ncbi:MAG: glycosyltransferase family 2 protein [Eubacterium sp.]|nr:glycosyltransferase family 2 protein [Eubacterium sp.]
MRQTVSIVIPVYKYLDKIVRCLDSFEVQTYSNFEVILVCHITTYEEIKRLSKKYSMNTSIIATGKDGVSACRNIGINNAKGDYISFVDSDDYVSERYIEVLVNEMRDDVLMTMCNYMHKFEDDNLVHNYKMSNKEFTADELINHMYGGVDQYSGFVWNKLFRTKIIREKNIRFDEAISLNEDRLFVITYLVNIDKNSKIRYNAETLYCYIQHKGSVTSKLNRGELEKEKAASEIDSFSQCEEMLENHDKIIDKLVRESVERAIMLLRLLKKNSGESKFIEKYLKKMRRKYRHLFSRRRRIQMFFYEHFLLRTIHIKLFRRTY